MGKALLKDACLILNMGVILHKGWS